MKRLEFDLIMCVKHAKYRLMEVCHTCCTRFKHSRVIISSYCVGALNYLFIIMLSTGAAIHNLINYLLDPKNVKKQ